MLAGHDPASVRFRLVIDLTQAVIVEIYQDYGMKFDEAINELQVRLTDPSTPKGRKVRAPDNESSMAMLQAMMKGSDFGGPKG